MEPTIADVPLSTNDGQDVYRAMGEDEGAAPSPGGNDNGHGNNVVSGVDTDPLPSTPSFTYRLKLYFTQLFALCYKSVLVLIRSPKTLLSLLLLPLIVVAIMWLVQSRLNASNNTTSGGADVTIEYEKCSALNVYDDPDPSLPCVSFYYSPDGVPAVQQAMRSFAARLGLQHGVDVVGVENSTVLGEILVSKIGRYDAAITFDDTPTPPCYPPYCSTERVKTDESSSSSSSSSSSRLGDQWDHMGTEWLRGGNGVHPFSGVQPCPIKTPLNISYTLWINQTDGYNEHNPSFLVNENTWMAREFASIPPRYWIVQHSLNLALTDLMTGVNIKAVERKMVEQHERRRLERTFKAMQESASSLHATLFSFYQGRTGSRNSDSSGVGEMDGYGNDSVPKYAGSTIMSIAVLVMAMMAMQLFAYEKQERILGILRIQGLSESAYWWSWTLILALVALFAAIVGTSMGEISGLHVYKYCDFAIHLVAIWLYIVAMVALVAVCVSCVQRSRFLNTLAFILFITAILCNAFFGNEQGNLMYRSDMPNILRIIFFIFPWFHYAKIWADILLNTSLVTIKSGSGSHDADRHVQFEYHWSQITQRQRIYSECSYGDESCCRLSSEMSGGIPYCYDVPSTSAAMGNLCILAVVYSVLAWYLAQVFGGNLGLNRRAWFLFTREYWGLQTEDDVQLAQLAKLNATAPQGQRVLSQDRIINEQFLSLRNNELRTYKLSKAYKEQSAVKEISLKMQSGEVFALLGHNGAGKSTLMNCLTGLLLPTAGHAFCFGVPLTSIQKLQSQMGVCMQDDLLFTDLTARETLRVFAAVRGIPLGQLERTVTEKLQQFHMQSYADTRVRDMSGGMQRRLSLSLATLGNPRFIVLDEPTTGMDPVNRNKIWSAVRELKRSGAIICLCTHNMEEADHLGDTVAMMSNGRMRAMGSPLFLKNRYGAGYQLQLLVNPIFHQQVGTIIRQLLPGCEIINTTRGGGGDANAHMQPTPSTETDDKPKDSDASLLSGDATGHGNFTIALKRSSLRALPSFFKWLDGEEIRWRALCAKEIKEAQQKAQRAAMAADGTPGAVPATDLHEMQKQQLKAQVLREWALSNSTLEEVFIKLCAHDKEINAKISDSAEDEDEHEEDDKFCMLCHERAPAALITLYSKSGAAVDFANLLCTQCSHSEDAMRMVGGKKKDEDAPIQLSSADMLASPMNMHQLSLPSLNQPQTPTSPGAPADTAAAAESTHDVASPKLRHGAAAAPTIQSTKPVHTTRGLNNELDLVDHEDEFYRLWDAMGQEPPTVWQQIRAVYIKNASLMAKQRKQVACKVLVLAICLFVIMTQTIVNTSLCPGGWRPADKKNPYSYEKTLTCDATQNLFMFAQQVVERPIVPFTSRDSSPPPSFDVYDCAPTDYAVPVPCGWAPRWATQFSSSVYNIMSPMPFTQDVLIFDGAARHRSLSDVPLSNWSWNYPEGSVRRYRGTAQFGFVDQTQAVIDGTMPNIPQPPTHAPKNNVGTRSGSPAPALNANAAVNNLDDIVWFGQQWVNNASISLPTVCAKQYGRDSVSAVVVFWNDTHEYPQQYVRDWMFSVYPPWAAQFRSNKPYPTANGQRLDESDVPDFVPELDYRLFYWDSKKLPQAVFYVYDDESVCSWVSPQGAFSQDVPHFIHAYDTSFLLTRMQSLYNSTDGNPAHNKVNFTRYWDRDLSQLPRPTDGTCPSPKLNARFAAFPSVQFTAPLSTVAIALALGFIVFLALMHLPATVSHLIFERESRLLHMMRISGIKDTSLWMGQYAWEMTVMISWFAVMLIVGFAFGSLIFTETNIGIWIGVSIVASHYIIMIGWLVGGIFSAHRIVLVVCSLLVVVSAFISIILDTYLDSTWSAAYLVVPPVAFIRSVSTIIRYTPSSMSHEAAAPQLLTCMMIMLFEGLGMGMIAIYLHVARYRSALFCFTQLCSGSKKLDEQKDELGGESDSDFKKAASASLLGSDASASSTDSEEDEDCAAERVRVENLVHGSPSDYPAIMLRNLRKVFGSGAAAKVAVDKLSMAVDYGSCLGLLGPNGAGKSTTLSILTGLLDATAGSAYLCGLDLTKEVDRVFRLLGICPQFDVVWDDLTVQEHLLFYARLKGIPKSFERTLVQHIAELTDLDGDPLLKPASALSGGMRRRLSLGISLIGNPSIWLLDEPSTGLSPETRREIWGIIERRKRYSKRSGGIGKSIVITTHSMEEADTLCDRIAIIAAGNLQCIGSSTHLKLKFGEGFKLTFHLQHEFDRAKVEEELNRKIGSNNVEEESKESSVSISMPSSRSKLPEPSPSSILARHVELLRFVSKMAPHARITSVEGKQVVWRLDAHKPGINVRTYQLPNLAGEQHALATQRTNEWLGIFNNMEKHRSELLPLYDVEEWGLQQASLEEVFLSICNKFEQEERIEEAGAAAGENKKNK